LSIIPKFALDDANERTIVLYEIDEMVNATLQSYSQLKKNMDACCDDKGVEVTINATPIWEGTNALKNRGIKIRWITDITKDNLDYCKEFMKVAEVRHLDGIKGAFGVLDRKCYLASANVTKVGRTYPGELIVSNVMAIIQQQQQIFNLLWDKAIPSNHRIMEIEQGLKREFIDTFRDPNEILNLIFKVLKSTSYDIKIIFSSSRTFKRFGDIGIVEVIKKSALEHKVDVKILVNIEKGEDEITKITKELTLENNGVAEERNHSIGFRPVMKSLFHTKITTFIVDSAFSLTVEMRDLDGDANEGFEESVGMATYSNNQSTVDSYATIFENLWARAGFAK